MLDSLTDAAPQFLYKLTPFLIQFSKPFIDIFHVRCKIFEG